MKCSMVMFKNQITRGTGEQLYYAGVDSRTGLETLIYVDAPQYTNVRIQMGDATIIRPWNDVAWVEPELTLVQVQEAPMTNVYTGPDKPTPDSKFEFAALQPMRAKIESQQADHESTKSKKK